MCISRPALVSRIRHDWWYSPCLQVFCFQSGAQHTVATAPATDAAPAPASEAAEGPVGSHVAGQQAGPTETEAGSSGGATQQVCCTFCCSRHYRTCFRSNVLHPTSCRLHGCNGEVYPWLHRFVPRVSCTQNTPSHCYDKRSNAHQTEQRQSV